MQLLVSVLLWLGVCAHSANAAVQSQLFGKSLTISWSETRLQRAEDEEEFRSVNASHSIRIYFSAVGRLFSRETVSTGAGSGTGNNEPGNPRLTASGSGTSLTLFLARIPRMTL